VPCFVAGAIIYGWYLCSWISGALGSLIGTGISIGFVSANNAAVGILNSNYNHHRE